MEKSVVALLLVKEHSKRLPGKNTMDFYGKPMFIWNLQKCLAIFDRVYVSSDSQSILNMARVHGAKGIVRGDELCGECPDITVYKHALEHMEEVSGIVAVHANNPTIEKNLITTVKKFIEYGIPEVMTSHPTNHVENHHNHSQRLNGSIRGMSVERLNNYPDPYKPEPEVLIVDTSIEIETLESYNNALCQTPHRPQS